MEIILGEKSGFCYGAENALTNVINLISNNKSGKVYCLGELLHNKQIIEDLSNKGIIFINDIKEIPDEDRTDDDKLIIRAHGVEKKIYEEIKKKNIEIFDYTCPNVLAIHKVVEDFESKGYFTILIGEKKHPETIGTYSFTNGRGIIIEQKEEIMSAIEKITKESLNKILIIAQTTFSKERFNEYIDIIKSNLNEDFEVVVKNTICNATKLRQEETEELAKNVDYMIIIGGKKSANSIKLYEIAKSKCKNSYFIETYKELEDKIDDIRKYNKVGIMAGASTPRKSVDEVINLLKQ